MSNKLKYLDKKGLAKVFSLIKFGHKKIWHGTLAEWEALSAEEKAEYDQAEVIDEYTGVPVVVDKVEAGNLNPVTSNAVAKIGKTYGTSINYTNKFPAISDGGRKTILSLSVPAGVYLVTVFGRPGDVESPGCNAAWPILNGNIQWCAGYLFNNTESGNFKNMRYFNYNIATVITKSTAGEITLQEYFEGAVPEHFYALQMCAVQLKEL